jgi:hypothetical protein
MVNVCRKMWVFSTFGVVLVGVAGFEAVGRSERYQKAGIGSLTHRRSHPSCMQFENFVSPATPP